MSRLPTISLISNWTVDYFENSAASLYEFMSSENVRSLANWTFDRRRTEGWLAWLQKKFDLPVMNNIACLNYLLEIDEVPYGAVLVINGREFGAVSTPFRMDVTDFIEVTEPVVRMILQLDTERAFSFGATGFYQPQELNRDGGILPVDLEAGKVIVQRRYDGDGLTVFS